MYMSDLGHTLGKGGKEVICFLKIFIASVYYLYDEICKTSKIILFMSFVFPFCAKQVFLES